MISRTIGNHILLALGIPQDSANSVGRYTGRPWNWPVREKRPIPYGTLTACRTFHRMMCNGRWTAARMTIGERPLRISNQPPHRNGGLLIHSRTNSTKLEIHPMVAWRGDHDRMNLSRSGFHSKVSHNFMRPWEDAGTVTTKRKPPQRPIPLCVGLEIPSHIWSCPVDIVTPNAKRRELKLVHECGRTIPNAAFTSLNLFSLLSCPPSHGEMEKDMKTNCGMES